MGALRLRRVNNYSEPEIQMSKQIQNNYRNYYYMGTRQDVGPNSVYCSGMSNSRQSLGYNSYSSTSSLCQGQIVLPYEALAKEPAKSRLGHCDLNSPQPINCQCEMPHHNYLFMIIFLSPVLLFWKIACKTRVHDVHDVRKLNRPIRWRVTKVIRVTRDVTISRPSEFFSMIGWWYFGQ